MTWLAGLLLIGCIAATIGMITHYFIRLIKKHKNKSAGDTVALDDEPTVDDTAVEISEKEETPDPALTESDDEN